MNHGICGTQSLDMLIDLVTYVTAFV